MYVCVVCVFCVLLVSLALGLKRISVIVITWCTCKREGGLNASTFVQVLRLVDEPKVPKAEFEDRIDKTDTQTPFGLWNERTLFAEKCLAQKLDVSDSFG